MAKFKDNAAFSGLFAPLQAEGLLKAIQELEQCNDISRFVREHLVFQKKPTVKNEP